ncbi:UNVERIFIED_CONTAM: hypothetical protein FKN15_054533 [Acipenser sinensis]
MKMETVIVKMRSPFQCVITTRSAKVTVSIYHLWQAFPTGAQLTATTPVLTQESEDEHMLSSEACAVSRPLFFTHHEATQELQRWRTTQL